MTQSAAEFEAALESYERKTFGRKYYWHCPRCSRGISNPKLLTRPFYRTDGPRVCGSCVAWEVKWERIEEQRRDHFEHLKESK
jgi:rubrerythrin